MVPGWIALTSRPVNVVHAPATSESAPVLESEPGGNDPIHAVLYSALRVRHRMGAEDAEMLAGIFLATHGVSHMQRVLTGPARHLQEAVNAATGAGAVVGAVDDGHDTVIPAVKARGRCHLQRDASTLQRTGRDPSPPPSTPASFL
jgi:hypothetical protein